jgi:zinc-ribbon domain/Domain of unknown function (DUF4352)
MTRIMAISSSIPATEGGTPLRKGVFGKGDGESVAEAPDRFCRNCGHELSPEDQFCPNCARPVHETATVPTPEADVPVPQPPPQTTGGAGGAAAPQQPAQEGGGGRRRHPILVGCLGVFVLLVVAIVVFFTTAIGYNEIINPLTGGTLLFGLCDESPAEQTGPKGKIGQTVKLSNVAWRVTAARRATELKAPSYPKKIGNFVIVEFLFTNNADEATTLRPSSLTLLDSEGCEFELDSGEVVYIAAGKNLFSIEGGDIPADTKVGPGVTKDGEAIFTVASDAKDFTLRAGDTDPFISDENAYIELGF